MSQFSPAPFLLIRQILIDFPMEEPPYHIHTQNTERSVKAVTEAAAAFVGHSARDGFVRARVHHSEMMPSFKSKKDIIPTFK